MKENVLIFVITLLLLNSCKKEDTANTTQPSPQQSQESFWNKLYGGTLEDKYYALIKTADGGYIAAGYTTSRSFFN